MPRAWWRMLGGAVAMSIAAAAAATGCAARPDNHAGPPAAKSPAATVTPTPASQAAAVGDPNGVLVPAPVPSAPPCPPLVRYAAGNAGPLFCSDGRDDPAALRYFAGLHLAIMQLPATARQSQAISAICADLRHTSQGAEYSAYLLAANAEHWAFAGIAGVHGQLARLCRPAGTAPSPAPSH